MRLDNWQDLENVAAHPALLYVSSRSPLRALAGGAAVTALGMIVFFFHLGAYGLWEPDEARYAEIAREMLTAHNFVIPHLNYVPYLEKPPLLYWLTAGSMKFAGINEFAARFVNAVAALIGVVATYFFTLRTFDYRRAVLAGAVLATSGLYAVMAQVLTTDMLLCAAASIAMFAFFLQWREGGRWWLICYFAIGAGVLTKGPIGAVLPLISATIFLWNEGQLRGSVRRFHLVAGLVIVASVSLPWFITVTIQQPAFFNFYFVGENLRRFLEPRYSHGEPIYFYLPVIAAGFLPWSLAMLLIPWPLLEPQAARRFCLIVAGTVITLFSAASAKLVPYILPAFPFAAVAAADGLMEFAQRDEGGRSGISFRFRAAAPGRPDSRRLIPMAIFLVLIGLVVSAVGYDAGGFKNPYPVLLVPILYFSAAAIVVGGITSAAAFWARRLEAGLGLLVGAAAATLMIITYGRIMIEPTRSYAVLARTIERRAPTARLICYPRYVESLPFYCRRRVILVGAKTELAYGAAHATDGPAFFFTGRDDVIRLWREPQSSVLVIDRGALAQIQQQLGAYTIVASDSKKLALIRTSPTSALLPQP
jgi:4-amino-4-deoxy-L-arabinose transferase-like glycosyltransferase